MVLEKKNEEKIKKIEFVRIGNDREIVVMVFESVLA